MSKILTAKRKEACAPLAYIRPCNRFFIASSKSDLSSGSSVLVTISDEGTEEIEDDVITNVVEK